MEGNRRLALGVGVFVMVSLAAMAVAILSLSSQQGVWRDRYRVVAYWENVQGLIPNAPVWLAGTQVGRVQSVAFDAHDGEPVVEVVLQIDRRVQPRIRGDSVASIGTIGLLGDRYVEVSLGTAAGEMLGEGDELGTLNPMDINLVIDKGALALDSIASLATNLNTVIEDFQDATGGKRLAASIGAMATIVMLPQK